jgi:SseB protein C-terminal domain
MQREPEQLLARQVRFFGEQDGPPERLLKDRLADLFEREGTIQKAYLSRADFGHGTPATVVLGLRMEVGLRAQIARKIGQVFADIFGSIEHLDIVFVDGQLEGELAATCRPFYPPRT